MSPNKIALLLLLISFNISVANGLKSPFPELKKFFETAVSLVAEKVKEAVEFVKCTVWEEACKKLCEGSCLDQQKACYSKCGNTKQQCDDECTKCSDQQSTECKDKFAGVCFPGGHEKAFKDAQEKGCLLEKCYELERPCRDERAACYSVCGNKWLDCSGVYAKCMVEDCLPGQSKAYGPKGPTEYQKAQEKACKQQQKKTFKHIPADDELEKPKNGQMEKSVGVNSSDVPPNATTTALTAIPIP
ncbi:hypothetical protein niasHS_008088 [Heterodera schachtii]|uniref:Uncharacterized protein n=1 Tax=Heterodera schachtii TaxID=97005 RepID=A0ABD2J7K7_HETSC